MTGQYRKQIAGIASEAIAAAPIFSPPYGGAVPRPPCLGSVGTAAPAPPLARRASRADSCVWSGKVDGNSTIRSFHRRRVGGARRRRVPGCGDPSTGEVIAQVAGTAADVDRAVVAARRAFEDPPGATCTRGALCAAESVRRHHQANARELAYLESMGSGGTVSRIVNLDMPLMVDRIVTMADIVVLTRSPGAGPPGPLPESPT